MPTLNPLAPLHSAMAAGLGRLLGTDRFPEEQYREPLGDPGLFGPHSITWRVHADLSMLVGGVADHSDYRRDPLRRLSRTSSFVSATTFAATPVAEAIISSVRAVHDRVTGVAPDGRPYAASDPDLLRWIHVAEVFSFLRAHQRYHPWPARGRDLDRYYAETAVVAERLGATQVPASRSEVRDYLSRVRPELHAGDQAREAMSFLLTPYGRDPLTLSMSLVITQAAADLLPGWARRLHDIRRPPLLDPAVIRPLTWSLLMAARIVAGPSPVLAQARARCATTGGSP